MNRPNTAPGAEPLLATGGIFVIKLRSDSDVARQVLHGRIEHIMSGHSEPFDDLAEMVAFMARQPIDATAVVQTPCPSTPEVETSRRPPRIVPK